MCSSYFSAKKQAKTIQEEAKAKADEMLKKAHELEAMDMKRIEEESKERARAAMSKADRDGKELAESIKKDLVEKAEQQCQNAQQYFDGAVEYLVKKVKDF